MCNAAIRRIFGGLRDSVDTALVADRPPCISRFGNIDSHELLIVVCGFHHRRIVGSKQKRCECGAIVWMTPDIQAALSTRLLPVRVVCRACIRKITVTPEARPS